MKIDPYERVKKWRENNPDKHREQWLRYYKANAEKVKAYKKAKRLLDKQKNETIQN